MSHIILIFFLKNLVVVSILRFISTAEITNLEWTCATNATGFEFNATRISGVWYEVARIPAAEVPACVKVTAPSDTSGSNYTLQVDYVNNVNKRWEPTNEMLNFPWNNDTKKGFFKLKYGTDPVSLTFIFKLIATDYDSIAFVCGYSSITTSYSLVKIMTRQNSIDSQVVKVVQSLARNYGIASELTWVEHSDRCNNAMRMVPTVFYTTVLVLTVTKVSAFMRTN